MKILITSAEVAPFAKAGGLADVIGALPKNLKKLGHDVRVIMPLYGCIYKKKHKLKPVENSKLLTMLGEKATDIMLYEGYLPNSNVKVYFVENYEYFGQHIEVYPQNQHYRFEQERYILFCKAVLESIKKIDFQPDVIHCNDWHTALIPTYLKNSYQDEFYSKIKTLFSIHNLAYQGWYSPEILEFAGLPKELFIMDKLEFYGDVNWMKGGIYFADAINTVSEKYAKEIQTPQYGERLEGFLKEHSDKLSGIVNGIDYSVWDPAKDKLIDKTYSTVNMNGKIDCKQNLQEIFDLTIDPKIPIISLVSRLVDQKGLDLIDEIGDELGKLPAQFIFLGTGSKEHEEKLRKLRDKHSNIVSDIRFCINLSHNVYAGSDFFLMPSKFEPCGLGQLISMKYGALPIARKTGGLADTVQDGKTGVIFEEYTSQALLTAIRRAIKIYNKKTVFFKKQGLFKKMQKTAMRKNFDWTRSAKKYIKLYNKILKTK